MDKYTNPNDLYYTSNDNLLVLKKTDEYFNKLSEENNLLHNIFNFIKSHIILLIILFIIILLIILYKYNKSHKEDFNELNNNNTNISSFFNDTQDANEDMANNFNRATFNPLHSINDNQNYNHYVGDDPLFNGVYNNKVHDIHYKPMDMLTNEMILDNYPYENINNELLNTNNILNTQPSYINANSKLPVSDMNYKSYRKINEENINGKIKMTFKPIN